MNETEFSHNSIHQRLEVPEGHGHVQLIHEPTRLFPFVDDPRENDDN